MVKINRNHEVGEKHPRKLRVLVAPLDWGLGHATRCIPVIYELLSQNVEVFLAGEGAQQQILQFEFPDLPFLSLSGYRVKYSQRSGGMLMKMLRQIPKITRAIRSEQQWLVEAVEAHQLDAVISDNRYGLHHPSIPSVFMTHQLQIQAKPGRWVERFLRRKNYKYINRFTECWVPDVEGEVNFAGGLSHPEEKPEIPVKYVGLLSRFDVNRDSFGSQLDVSSTVLTQEVTIIPRHLFISLSGPEPQRSLLEDRIVEEVSHYNGTATIVRGLPGHAGLIPSSNDIRFYNHLETTEYRKAMLEAEIVVCRGGYSTIMDILSLQKRSILIPTPGQTEQEYLCRHLQEKGYAMFMTQKDFSLAAALSVAEKFKYKFLSPKGDALKKTVSAFLARI